MKSAANETLSEVERIPVHYYEDGIDGFELALRPSDHRKEHWSGNSAYTLTDAIKSIMKSK